MGEDGVEFGNRLSHAQRRQFASNDRDLNRPWQSRVAECLEDLLDGGNGAQTILFHGLIEIFCCAERTIRPMIDAQGVRQRFNSFKTASSRRGATQSSKPPLVCASARRILCISLMPFQAVNVSAKLRLSRLPPGTHFCPMSLNTSGLIAGTRAAKISAPTPLARHIEPKCPRRPKPVTSTPARTNPLSPNSAPGLFSERIMLIALLASAPEVRPRLMPVVAMPVPS